MKKLTYVFVLAAFMLTSSNTLMAQRGGGDDVSMEVKVNPIGILFGNADLAIEFIRSDNFGIEVAPSFNSRTISTGGEDVKYNGFGLAAYAKYYFNPDGPASKFYIAPYVRFARTSGSLVNSDSVSNTRVAGGMMFGYKWLSGGPITFELGLGLGRAFVNNWEGTGDLGFNLDGVGRFAVGYRF